MNPFKAKLGAAVILACSALSGLAMADELSLEQSVQRLLDPANFDLTMLDKESVSLVEVGQSREYYSLEDIENVLKSARQTGTVYKYSDFQVLYKDDSGKFGSINYKVTWTTMTGNTTTTTHMIAHEIWEHSVSGWIRVFQTLEE